MHHQMIRYRTILDRNRNKSCRIHSGTSCPYIFIADGNVVYHSYDTIHALSLNFQRRKKVKMKVFYLLTVCFRSLVEPASLLGFSDQLEDPSYLFSKQNSQFQSKFQFQQTTRLLLRCVSSARHTHPEDNFIGQAISDITWEFP